MYLLYRTSLKQKLLLLLLPLLATTVWLSYSSVYAKYQLKKQMWAVEQQVQLAQAVGNLINEMQKERGLTSGFLISKGTEFSTDLDRQKKQTDAARQNVSLLHYNAQRLDELKKMREDIVNFRVSAANAIKFYNNDIGTLLNVIGKSDTQVQNGGIARQLGAYYALLNLKNMMGSERAFMSGVFVLDHFQPGQLAALNALVAGQAVWQHYFLMKATPQQAALFTEASLTPSFMQALSLRNTALSRADSGGWQISAREWYEAQTQRIEALHDIEKSINKDIKRAALNNYKQASREEIMFLIICLAAFITSALVAWIVIRTINLQLRSTINIIENMDGDLTQRLAVRGTDEISVLNKFYNQSIENIQSMVREIKNNAAIVRKVSSEIASENDELAKRTEEQAASLTETSASIEQISTAIDQNSDNARRVETLAQHMVEHVESASKSVGEANLSMQDIRSFSEQIAGIVSSINNISSQTNLLALNAAVEAARAGDLGKGFTVVAAEVRNLSRLCANEADMIQKLIAQNINKIEEGAERVLSSEHILRSVVGDAGQMKRFIDDIADASAEQSAGIAQIQQALNQMGQVTEQNVSMVSEAANSSHLLHDQSEAMSNLVNKFIVE